MQKKKEISLQDFIKLEKERLDIFFDNWVENNVKDSENFPMFLAAGDWDEQFQLYNS